MTRSEFVEFAVRDGWVADRHSHYQKVKRGKRYRLKMGERSVRYEIRSGNGNARSGNGNAARWVLLASNYYSRLKLESVNGVERLAGLVLGKRTGEA